MKKSPVTQVPLHAKISLKTSGRGQPGMEKFTRNFEKEVNSIAGSFGWGWFSRLQFRHAGVKASACFGDAACAAWGGGTK